MAYNPFHWFRKHQKVFFAGLTILCMMVFIFQFGPGDLFQSALGWIGARANRGPDVAKLNGKPVSEEELSKLAARRRAASEFLVAAVGGNILASASELARDASKEKGPARDVREMAASIQRDLLDINKMQDRRGGFDPQMFQRIQTLPVRLDSYLTNLPNYVRAFKPAAKDEKEAAAERADFLRTAERVGALVGFLRWRFNRDAQTQLYLGGGLSAESLLDFLIWQQQADKLGITLTNEDVMKEVEAEAAGADVFDPKRREFTTDPFVQRYLAARSEGRRGPSLPPSELLSALKDEFKVAAAQSLLLGIAQGGRSWKAAFNGTPNGNPGVGTPHEFLEYYRDQRTTMRVRLTPIPAEAFLKDVKGEPSDKEVEALFGLFRDKEPAPGSRDPGFKEPRRFLAQYVVGSPDDKYFADRAREAVHGTRPEKGAAAGGMIDHYADWRRARDVTLAPALTPLGAGPFGKALAVAMTLQADPIQANYGEWVLTKRGWYDDPVTVDPDVRLLNVAVENAAKATLASQVVLAGLAPGRVGAATPLFAMAALPEGTATAKTVLPVLATQDMRRAEKSLRVALPLLLAHSTPEMILSAPAFAAARFSAPIPREALEPLYLTEMQRRYAAGLMMANMEALAEKLDAYKGKGAPPSGTLEKEAAALHLAFHTMTAPMTKPGVIDALRRKQKTGLDALRAEMEKAGTVTPEALGDAVAGVRDRFAPRFLSEFWAGRRNSEAFFPFSARAVADREPEGRARVVLWLTEEHNPRLRSYNEAEPLVKEAWRMDQARSLARKVALAVAAKVNEKKGTPRDAAAVIAEERARETRVGEGFDLEGVAQLIQPSRETLPLRRTDYKTYEVPLALADQLPYPPVDPNDPRDPKPTNLPKLLLELKRPGDAMVIADRPARTFYVAVLEVRDEPSVSELGRVYAEGLKADSIYGDFRFSKQVDYVRGVLTQLRREAAGKVDADGRIELPEDTRKRFSGRPEESGE